MSRSTAQWQLIQDSVWHTKTTALCGYYRAAGPVPRQRYYVEILGIFCQNFGVEIVARNNDFDAWLNFDFQKVCLEYQGHNHLTLDGASIEIESVVPPFDAGGPQPRSTPGRWRSTVALDAIQPLCTRHQPPQCRNPKQQDALFCAERTNATALYNFEFEWQDVSWINTLVQNQNRSQDFPNLVTACRDGPHHKQCVQAAQDFHQDNSLPKISFVGASRADDMANFMVILNFKIRFGGKNQDTQIFRVFLRSLHRLPICRSPRKQDSVE